MQTPCTHKPNKKTQILQCNRNEHYSYSTEEKCYKSNGSTVTVPLGLKSTQIFSQILGKFSN